MHSLLRLQREAGNRAVSSMLARTAAEGGDKQQRLSGLVNLMSQQRAAAVARGAEDHPHVVALDDAISRIYEVLGRGDDREITGVLAAFTPDRLAVAKTQVMAQDGTSPAISSAEATAPLPVQLAPVQRSSLAETLIEFGTTALKTDAALAPEEASNPVGWGVAAAIAVVGVAAIGAGLLMSSGGRPKRNVDQNKQFADAIKEIERRIGRRLSKDEIRRIHEALHGESDPGFHDIVEVGLNEVGGGVTEGSGPSDPADAGPVGADDEE